MRQEPIVAHTILVTTKEQEEQRLPNEAIKGVLKEREGHLRWNAGIVPETSETTRKTEAVTEVNQQAPTEVSAETVLKLQPTQDALLLILQEALHEVIREVVRKDYRPSKDVVIRGRLREDFKLEYKIFKTKKRLSINIGRSLFYFRTSMLITTTRIIKSF